MHPQPSTQLACPEKTHYVNQLEMETLAAAPIFFVKAGVLKWTSNECKSPNRISWYNKEKKNVKKKVIVTKSRSLVAMFVSENSINHFIWSKIHPINTMEAHLRHFKQAIYPTSVKLNFTKRPLAAILFYQCGPQSIGFLSITF